MYRLLIFIPIELDVRCMDLIGVGLYEYQVKAS